MSMDLMVRVMKVKVGDPLSKLALLKLADNASDKGECWPSYQHIADHCEIDRRTAMNHIAKLCACGFLRKERRKGPGGNASNVYFITPENGDAGMLKNFKPVKRPRVKGSEPHSPGGDPDSLPGVSDSPGGSEPCSPASVSGSPGGSDPRSPESVTLLNQSMNQSKDHSQPAGQSDDVAGKTEKSKQQPRIDYQGCMDAYNEVLGDRLPWAKDLTNDRKTKIRLMLGRLKTPTVSGFRAYMQAFSDNARSFYFGDNNRNWRANIDFLLREKTLVAVREGTISDSTEVQE